MKKQQRGCATPGEWETFCDKDKANYAIGGPSVEMYVKSYNQAYNGITDSNVYTLGVRVKTIVAPGYLYTLDGAQSTISKNDCFTGSNSLNYTRCNSMYCGKDGTYWWLSSPCGNISDTRSVCCVDGAHVALNGALCGTSLGVSPLVSLKSSFIPEVEE